MAQLGSALKAFRDGLYDAAVLLNPAGSDVQVVRGRFSSNYFCDAVVIGVARSQSSPATLSNLRTREELLTCEVIIYGFRSGGEEVEEAAQDAAWSILNGLEEYVRVTNTTLNGAVRQCFLTEHDSGEATDDVVVAQGRMYVISATFTAQARITS